MDNLTKTNNGSEPEIEEMVSLQPVDEAETAEVAEAVVEQAVVVKPKRGLGLAAFFTRRRPEEPTETSREGEVGAPAQDAGRSVLDNSDTLSDKSVSDISDGMARAEAIIEAAAEGDSEAIGDHETVAPHKNGQLKSVLECMLFVSDGPLTAKQLAATLELEERRVEEALGELEEHLDSRGGIKLMRVAGGFQLCTKPEYADYCAMLLQPAKKRLSKAALETLAVVAYRQPCTMPEIEAVRGVAVDGVMKTICERGLIKEAGRKQTPGRPILYATTPEFLEYFGLNDLTELPDIDMLAVEEVKALEAQKELFSTDSEETSDGEG